MLKLGLKVLWKSKNQPTFGPLPRHHLVLSLRTELILKNQVPHDKCFNLKDFSILVFKEKKKHDRTCNIMINIPCTFGNFGHRKVVRYIPKEPC